MKKTNRILAILLAALMLVGVMATGAMALDAMQDEGTVTIENAVAGVTYKFYRILDISGIANDETAAFITNAKWHAILKNMNAATGGTHYGKVNGDTVGSSVTGVGSDADGQQLAAAVLAAAGTSIPDPDWTEEVTTSGVVEVEDLQYGYYIVESTREGATNYVTFTLKAATLTMREKNDALPKISKKVKGADGGYYDGVSADFNTVLEYAITITAAAGTDTYVITDMLPAQIEYVTDSMKMTKDGTECELNVDYTVATDENGMGIITLMDDFRASLKDGDEFVISYKGKLLANMNIGTAYTNSATLTYGTESKGDDAHVYSGSISFYKKDNNNVNLADAKFVVQNKDGKYAQLTPNGDDYDFAGWVDTQEAATVIITKGAATEITVRGLAAGTYTLVETQAPTGYIKGADTDVTINKTVDANNSVTGLTLPIAATITNTKGSELPSTGGIGTTIFYIAGGILVLCALALVIVKRKKAE